MVAQVEAERHVATCPDCRVHLQSLRSGQQVLQQARTQSPSNVAEEASVWGGVSRQIRVLDRDGDHHRHAGSPAVQFEPDGGGDVGRFEHPAGTAGPQSHRVQPGEQPAVACAPAHVGSAVESTRERIELDSPPGRSSPAVQYWTLPQSLVADDAATAVVAWRSPSLQVPGFDLRAWGLFVFGAGWGWGWCDGWEFAGRRFPPRGGSGRATCRRGRLAEGGAKDGG